MDDIIINKAKFDRLKFCNFKLETILEITLAINDNLSTNQLLAKYTNILQEKLNIGKVLVYNYNKEWTVIVKSGIAENSYQKISVENDLLPQPEITTGSATNNGNLEEFDVIIPVYHNNKAIAFVLIGDIDEEKEGISPTIKHLHFIQTLTNIIIVAIENRRLYEQSLKQEAMRKELELASRMQAMLIPDSKSFPQTKQIHVYAFYRPHYEVGGDYYDFLTLSPNEVGFCIADVSGKGISAALLMSNFQANLRALFTAEISLTDLVLKLNDRVMSNAHAEKFITLFVAKYNTATRVLDYINAGHNPPVLYSKATGLQFLTQGCVGLGMLDEIPVIRHGTMALNESKLVCFTDGLVEIEDDNEQQIGNQVIEECLATENTIKDSIENMIAKLLIREGNKSIFDDISILGIESF